MMYRVKPGLWQHGRRGEQPHRHRRIFRGKSLRGCFFPHSKAGALGSAFPLHAGIRVQLGSQRWRELRGNRPVCAVCKDHAGVEHLHCERLYSVVFGCTNKQV